MDFFVLLGVITLAIQISSAQQQSRPPRVRVPASNARFNRDRQRFPPSRTRLDIPNAGIRRVPQITTVQPIASTAIVLQNQKHKFTQIPGFAFDDCATKQVKLCPIEDICAHDGVTYRNRCAFHEAKCLRPGLVEVHCDRDTSHKDFREQFGHTLETIHDINMQIDFRYANFLTHLEAIEFHSVRHGKSSYQLGINDHSHLAHNEFEIYLKGDHEDTKTGEPRDQTSIMFYVPKDIGREPDQMDYRNAGAVNPIRNQYPCGSCWAFSAVSSIESQIFKKIGRRVQLSEQHLIDCSKGVGFSHKHNHNGCDGGWKRGALKYVINSGIAYRDNYQYIGPDSMCKQNATKNHYGLKEIKEIHPGNDNELLNALVHLGPIAVSLHTSVKFHVYDHGVFEDEGCFDANIHTDHAVLLVGYGIQDGKKYWLIRNSWGEIWGESGYMKLSRDKKNHCLISSKAYVPIIEVIS